MYISRQSLTARKTKGTGGLVVFFYPGALSHLGSPYRNEGPSLQMVPLLGRSLGPPGWGCQFRAAETSVVGTWSGTVQKGPAEVEGETDCIFNLLHSLGG